MIVIGRVMTVPESFVLQHNTSLHGSVMITQGRVLVKDDYVEIEDTPEE
jgi:hypothetical protein